MIKLSEGMRSSLNNLIEDLKSQETIIGTGIFGSWSRGDAVQNSDVDMLIVDKRDLDHEHIERIEFDNLIIDLNYVPEKWMTTRVPPDIDQKIYEVEVLYDRSQILTKIRDWMRKNYWAHERVDLRTESYLLDAYAYQSRATSAQNRDDLRSASVYASLGLDSILKILIEVNMLPISNTHFIENLKSSVETLNVQDKFYDYLKVSRLLDLNRAEVEDMLRCFEAAWSEVITSIESLASTLKTLHIKVRRSLNYYGKPLFLKGMITRSRALIDDGAFIEAGHYINRTFIDMLENYAWLALGAEGLRFDYTRLFSSLERLESSKGLYENTVRTFRLDHVSPREVEFSLNKAKEIINQVRQIRKDLIKSFVKPPRGISLYETSI